MGNDRFINSRFWDWYVRHRPFTLDEEQTLRQEALTILVDCVNSGEIASLDGTLTPLAKRISAHHGVDDFEMNSNWICASQDWVCPCCERSKFQISRIGRKRQILAKLVIHHDHMGEALEAAFHCAFESAGTGVEQVEGRRLVERMQRAFAAYEEVLICEDCNNADTEAKKIAGSPEYFSFSIGQITQFISSCVHQPHRVDALKVAYIWQQAQPAYDLRMQLIRSVAHAAATDAHWYEPYPRGTHAIPVLGMRSESGDHAIRQWVSSEQLIKELGPKAPRSIANLSRWRNVSQKAGKPLPANFLAMLRSEEVCARAWDSVPEDWRCPYARGS